MLRVFGQMAAALGAAAICFPASSHAAESAGRDPLLPRTVIQERSHQPLHEGRLGIGYLPQDPFYKAWGPELAYVWHRGDWVELELLRFAYFSHLETDIRRQVASEFGERKDPYEKARWLAMAHARWVPSYGRYTVMNRGVVHQETFLSAGGGIVGWDKAEVRRKDGLDGGGGGARPAFDLGLGFRFYTSKRTSMTIEVHDQFFMRSDGSLATQFYLSIGASFAKPRPPRPASLE